jgi:hypothetical protein
MGCPFYPVDGSRLAGGVLAVDGVASLGLGGDLGDTVCMGMVLLEHALGTLAQTGWGDVVDSLKGAIEDRSHVVTLGIAAAVVLSVWVNYKVAKWLLSLPHKPSS